MAFKIKYICDKYIKISKELTRKPFTINANKGNVYASDGNLLATSMSKFTIRMDVMSVKAEIFNKDVVELSKSLADFLGKSPSFFEKNYGMRESLGIDIY